MGQHCTRTRVCGLGGCKEVHHRLLHKDHNTTNFQGGENKLFTKPKQKVGCETIQEPAAVKDKLDQRVDCPKEGGSEQTKQE